MADEAIESGGYAAVLLVDEGLGTQLRVNEACRRAGTAFLSASSRGAFASLFCDFGEDFVVEDADGEEAKVIRCRFNIEMSLLPLEYEFSIMRAVC